MRRSLAIALRAQGFTVFDVPDAHAARRAVGSLQYDVILLDLGLPDEDGIRLLPDLRAHHDGPIVVAVRPSRPVGQGGRPRRGGRRLHDQAVRPARAPRPDPCGRPTGRGGGRGPDPALRRRPGPAGGDRQRWPRGRAHGHRVGRPGRARPSWRRAGHPRGPAGPGVGRGRAQPPQLRPRLHQHACGASWSRPRPSRPACSANPAAGTGCGSPSEWVDPAETTTGSRASVDLQIRATAHPSEGIPA